MEQSINNNDISYGRVTSSNPYLGYFVHAPSTGNVGAKYFHEQVTEEEDWQRQKALRNKPNSGWFHPRPGSYSRLHNRYFKADTYFTRQASNASPISLTASASTSGSHTTNKSLLGTSDNLSTTSSSSSISTTSATSTISSTHPTTTSSTAADLMNIVMTAKLQHASKKIQTVTSLQESLTPARNTARSIPPRSGKHLRGTPGSIYNKSGSSRVISPRVSPRVSNLQNGTYKQESRERSISDNVTSMRRLVATKGNRTVRAIITTPPGFHRRTGSMPVPKLSLNTPQSFLSTHALSVQATSRSNRSASTHSDPSSTTTHAHAHTHNDGIRQQQQQQQQQQQRPKSINFAKATKVKSSASTLSPRVKHGPASYSQQDVVGRGALHSRRRPGGRSKVASVDLSHFDPKMRKSAGDDGDGFLGNSTVGKSDHGRRHVSADATIIARDEFGRRVKSNSGSDMVIPTYLFGTGARRMSSSSSPSFDKSSDGEGNNNNNGNNEKNKNNKNNGNSNHGRTASYVISPSHTPSSVQSFTSQNWGDNKLNSNNDMNRRGSLRLSSPSHNNTKKKPTNNDTAWPEGGRYAMVSGGARKAPSIEQLKPWTVQTEAEITDMYIIEQNQMLGEGTYSRVYSATHRELGGVFAVKCIEKAFLVSEEEKISLKREVELHLRLHHPHIVRLYEVYEDPQYLWLVMECISQGTLTSLCDYSGKIESEDLACRLIHQIIKAVQYLHTNGILHSDIKPDNVVVDRPDDRRFGTSNIPSPIDYTPKIKLCDFGLAKKVPDVKYFKYTHDVHKVPFTGVCGTPGYIAPELLQRQPYGISADMWSIGIILYELIAGRPPFRPASRCLERPVAFEGMKWHKASKEVIDLVQRLLVVDASQRISAKEALKHPWFTKFGEETGYVKASFEPRVM